MNEKVEAWLVSLNILLVVAVAYLAAWRGKHKAVQRSGFVVVAAIAGAAALWAACSAVGLPGDLSIPGISVWEIILAEVVTWSIALGLGLFAIKTTRSRLGVGQ